MWRATVVALFLGPVVYQAPEIARRVAPTPRVSIGTLDGPKPTQLSRIYGAIRLSDGSIVVGNSESQEMRFFDVRGTYVRSVGRKGSGPGEFSEYSSLVFHPVGRDQLYVPDGGNQRVNVFDVRGAYHRTFRVVPPSAEGFAGIAAIAGTEIVALTMRNAALRGAPGARIDATMAYAIFDTLGRPVRSLFEVAGRSRLVHSYQGITHYPYIPFSPEALVAARGDRIYLLRNLAPEIEVWSRQGQRVATWRWHATRVPVRTVWDRYKAAELAAATRERDKVLYGHYYDMDLPMPELVPVGSRLVVSADDHLWIERYRLPWDTIRRWDVLDPRGRYLGAVETPARLDVYQIGTDFLLGRMRDSLDVEQVQVYDVRK
jgi:6-bladed beta-propeller